MAAAREPLSEGVVAAAWAEGQKLTTEQAVALVLEAIDTDDRLPSSPAAL
jgi:hypothetical protein